MALFGEKYGDRVRVVTVGCDDAPLEAGDLTRESESASQAPSPKPQASFCSRELCGGTHVGRTGEIGYVRLLSEGGVAAGVRRIEALTGRGAAAWADSQAATLRDLAARLGVPPTQLADRVDSLLAELKQRQQDLNAIRSQAVRGSLDGLLSRARRDNGITTLVAQVEAPDAGKLREMGDWLRDKVGSGIVILGAVINEKPQVLAMVSADLVKQGYHAGNLVKSLAAIMGGGGGGRPDMAQAGGRDAAKLGEALAQAQQLIGAQHAG
jgi:alanyl-tRNA synthetase